MCAAPVLSDDATKKGDIDTTTLTSGKPALPHCAGRHGGSRWRGAGGEGGAGKARSAGRRHFTLHFTLSPLLPPSLLLSVMTTGSRTYGAVGGGGGRRRGGGGGGGTVPKTARST